MNTKGIVRKMDNLGRVVLPAELRRLFLISQDDYVEIYALGDEIRMKKFQTIMNILENVKQLKYTVTNFSNELGEEKASEARGLLIQVEELLAK